MEKENMEQLLVTPDMSATIANLAGQLKISKTDVLQQAISEYAEKVSKKKRLMSFAGILSKTEADNLSTAINCAFRDSAKQEFENQKQVASASFRFQPGD
ncbi:MAG: hypothetical protein B6245_15280 [Desulfobacteraceae bacterium 4572_88]|nr:MAG: hypothetical protein B6245_15280 [Desulfobacteraceae bacterium 4572_88]